MKISSAESQIMEALWNGGALTPDKLVDAVGPANGWARNTVRVMITRLLKKGAISSAKEGGRFLYRPQLARSDYLLAESRGLRTGGRAGQLAPLVANLAEHRQLTPEDVATLKALIAEIDDDGR